jgi:hypothetical protein
MRQLGQLGLGPCGDGAPDSGLEFVLCQPLFLESCLEHGLRSLPVRLRCEQAARRVRRAPEAGAERHTASPSRACVRAVTPLPAVMRGRAEIGQVILLCRVRAKPLDRGHSGRAGRRPAGQVPARSRNDNGHLPR